MNKRIWLIPVIIIAFILISGLASAFNWNNGIVSYWKLDEPSIGVVTDSIGYWSGYPSGGLTVNQAGILGNAYKFTNSTLDYVLMNNSNQSNLKISGNMTMNVWVKFGVLPTINQVIAGKTATNNGHLNYQIFINSSGWIRGVSSTTTVAGGLGTCNNDFYVNSNGAVSTGAWHMATYQYNSATQNLSLWIDGVSTSNTSIASYPYLCVNWTAAGLERDFTIGASRLASVTQYLNGTVDEVGVWNRTLTGAEIIELYNGGAGITYPIPQIIVSLVSPANNSNVSIANQTFVCNASSTDNLTSIEFDLWNSSGGLILSSIQAPNSTVSPPTVMGYYENANVSSYTGDWTYGHPEREYDNDWNTYAQATGFPEGTYIGEIYMNYTKPIGALGGTWRTRDSWENNLSIPSSCWNYNTTTVILRAESEWTWSDGRITIHGHSRWYCYDGAWSILRDVYYIGGGKLYEDGVFWYSNLGGGITSTINTFNISLPYEDTFHWNCKATDVNGLSNWSATNNTLNFIPYIDYVQGENSDPIATGSNAIFTLNVTMPTGQTTMNATFRLNQTLYNPDSIIYNGTDYFFTKTINLPSNYGNLTGNLINWSWNYTIGVYAVNHSTNITNITIISVNLTDCDTTTGHLILAMDLVNEETRDGLFNDGGKQTKIEIDLNVTDWLNSSNSWNFHKQWINDSNISVCISNGTLNLKSYRIDVISEYGATTYVSKFWYLDNGTLNLSTYFNPYTNANITLFDLPTTDSTTFLFTYTDENGLAISNALIHTYRKYISNGTYLEVERSKQDTNGETHVHLVEEDVIYYFMITQYGAIKYTSETYNAKCLSTPCSISLSSGGTSPNWSIINYEGGRYVVSSNKSSRIVNLTYTLTDSSLVNMTLYRYDNNGLTVVNESNSTGASGTMSVSVPTAYGNTSFFVVIYKDNQYIKSEWVDFRADAKSIFGTFGVILACLIVLSLMLMGITEGAGFIVFTIVGLIVVALMTLVDLGWLALISIICAGGIIIWKLIQKKR
jgi:hypothetical protein